jgi:hypothetical protein
LHLELFTVPSSSVAFGKSSIKKGYESDLLSKGRKHYWVWRDDRKGAPVLLNHRNQPVKDFSCTCAGGRGCVKGCFSWHNGGLSDEGNCRQARRNAPVLTAPSPSNADFPQSFQGFSSDASSDSMPGKSWKKKAGTDCQILDFRDLSEWQRYCLANGGAMGASTHHLCCDPRRKMKTIGIIDVETRLGGCIKMEMVLKGRT